MKSLLVIFFEVIVGRTAGQTDADINGTLHVCYLVMELSEVATGWVRQVMNVNYRKMSLDCQKTSKMESWPLERYGHSSRFDIAYASATDTVAYLESWCLVVMYCTETPFISCPNIYTRQFLWTDNNCGKLWLFSDLCCCLSGQRQIFRTLWSAMAFYDYNW